MSETEGYPEDVAQGLGEDIPDRSEQLDQIQPEESLDDRGVDDVLDEGLTTPERWSPEERTDPEDTLDERVDEEVPEPDDTDLSEPGGGTPQETPAEDVMDDGEVGGQRAGRLVDEDEGIGPDTEPDLVGSDVGIDAAAAGAEEAAVHVVPEGEEDVNETLGQQGSSTPGQ